MLKIKTLLPGIMLAALLAFPATILGKYLPLVGAPVIGILLGMLLAGIQRPDKLNDGIKFTAKIILQYSIILLGFEMNFFNVLKAGRESLVIMAFTLSAAFLTAYIASKALKVPAKAATLIGVGTAICGGSAIAATAPVIKADEKEVAHAISTIFFFNIIAAFLFPFLGHLMQMDDIHFGLWAGTAINDTSSVVAAGYSYSDEAGRLAVIVKLARTLMIIPITLFLAFFTAKQNAGNNYSIKKIFPWFIVGFLLTALFHTFQPLPSIDKALVQCGKYMIVMAMAAIGLNTNLPELIRNSGRSLLLGFSCWVVLSIVALLCLNM